jgi:hypothetical protein
MGHMTFLIFEPLSKLKKQLQKTANTNETKKQNIGCKKDVKLPGVRQKN